MKNLYTLSVFRFAMVVCLTGAFGTLAAQIAVEGQVKDEFGDPLVGVNVLVEGTGRGTITDLDGKFSLDVAPEDVLVFSYTGFESQRILVGDQTRFNIDMKTAFNALEEVVITAYGSTKKRDLIGAVDQIQSRNIENMPVSSFDQALAGQTAGVQLRQGSGQPGAGAEILIRGIGSISAGNQPLIVIDGLPFGNYNAQTDNFLALLDPNTIENISIVRDASGKALYGSRAANGLILITTKRGRKGKPTIEFNTYAGLQTVPPWEKPDILNATELAQFLRERIEDQALVDGTTPNIPPQLENPEMYGEGTNWYDEITRNAWMYNANLNVRGGSDNFRYSFGFGYFDQDGVVIETNLKRYSFRANLDVDVTDWLHLGFELSPSWTKNQSGNTDPGGEQFSVYNTINVAQWADPTATVYDENGNMNPTTLGALLPFYQANPVFKLREENVLRNNRQVLFGSKAKIDLPVKGLYFKSYFGATYLNNASRNFSPGSVVGRSLQPANPDPAANSFASAGRYESLRWVWENTINYNRSFADDQHKLDVLAGYVAEFQQETFFNGSGSRIIDENFQLFNSGNVATNLASEPDITRIFFSAGESISEQALISYLGRVQYSFRDKYYLNAAIRVDGSSRFGPENRFAPFPSLGLAWRASEEPWFPTGKVLSNFRIEGSWGLSGNNRIGNYAWQGQISTNANYVLGGGQAEGAFLGSIPNPALGWEETEQFDIGLDFGFLNNRINLDVDLYQQNSKNLLYSVPLPRITGFGSYLTNLGEIRNRGIEININSQPIVGKKFVWTLNVNASYNRNKVIQLGQDNLPIRSTFAGNGTPVSWTIVGEQVAQFYGLQVLGLYTQELLDDPSIPKYPGAVVGSPYYVDGDGDGTLESLEDYVQIGNPWPDLIYGLSTNLTYGAFDLRIVVNGEIGSEILDLQREFMLNTDGVFNVRSEVKDRFRPGDTDFSIRPPTTTSVPSSQRYRWPNNLGVIDGSFLKVSNIQLTYNLRPLLRNQNIFKGGSVYFAIQNALVISEWRGNPEIRRANVGSLERNINYGSYPVPRTFTLGFNVSL